MVVEHCGLWTDLGRLVDRDILAWSRHVIDVASYFITGVPSHPAATSPRHQAPDRPPPSTHTPSTSRSALSPATGILQEHHRLQLRDRPRLVHMRKRYIRDGFAEETAQGAPSVRRAKHEELGRRHGVFDVLDWTCPSTRASKSWNSVKSTWAPPAAFMSTCMWWE